MIKPFPSDWIGRESMKKRKADDIKKCPKCLAYYSLSHAKEFGHWCSELIAGLVKIKGENRKSDTCVWRDVNGRFVPGCVTDFSSYAYATTVCVHCGKRVEIKKNV